MLPRLARKTHVVQFIARCKAARYAGGLALQDVVERRVAVPEGWWLDHVTDYYLPAEVALLPMTQRRTNAAEPELAKRNED